MSIGTIKVFLISGVNWVLVNSDEENERPAVSQTKLNAPARGFEIVERRVSASSHHLFCSGSRVGCNATQTRAARPPLQTRTKRQLWPGRDPGHISARIPY